MTKVGATDGNKPGYNRITLLDLKTKEKKTFYVPVGKKFSINGKEYDIDKTTNKELVITGTKGKKDSKFGLVGLALEHLDVNKDGCIDENDTSGRDLESQINKELKDSPYYVKHTDLYGDAGITKGEGIVVFSRENSDGKYEIYIE